LWLLSHRAITSDEAVAGLIGQQILHGKFSAFYWGQSYGGVEPYLVAPAFWVFGATPLVLESVAACLSALSAVISWRIATHLVRGKGLAALAGALIWVAPLAAVSNSTFEFGFRAVTLASGLGVLLAALKIYDGQKSLWIFGLLGLVAGIGWWSSPEIVYFYVPAGLLLLAALIRSGAIRPWLPRFAATVVCGFVGSLPWWWVNIHSHWRSLDSSSFAQPPHSPGYGSRVRIFFEYMLPMLAGVRHMFTGAWIGSRVVGETLLLVVLGLLVVATGLCLLASLRTRILAGSLLVAPFLLTISPATWFWEDNRYADLLFPLVALVLIVGFDQLNSRIKGRTQGSRPRGHSIGAKSGDFVGVLITVLSAGLCVIGFTALMPLDSSSSFFSNWSNPNEASVLAISKLESGGVRNGYADYWVAYKLDFMSAQHLKLTTIAGDDDRSKSLDAEVRHAKSQAWLFVEPTKSALYQFAQTGAIQGPDGLPEAQFLKSLADLKITYRVVDAGLVQAIIPARSVSAAEIGLP
jgi:hypothetical protein